jgi:hypothetical protein
MKLKNDEKPLSLKDMKEHKSFISYVLNFVKPS